LFPAALMLAAMSRPNHRFARTVRRSALTFPFLLAGGAWAAPAPAPVLDPLHTLGDKNPVLFENQLVRVLRYHDEPGATTHPHHQCFVLYALAPFKRELIFPDSSHRAREFRAGDATSVITQDARQAHTKSLELRSWPSIT